ncbi:MAG: FAD-dependent oxidoreductase [Victivallales bacterium]|nr:FAD-dependent oxidoreductase [Victivallales bacterium]
MTNPVYDVVIVGAGSGGVGAAIGAARSGARTLLLDASPSPGGVVASAWVHNWEPTCGNSRLTREIWSRMRAMPGGAPEMPFTTSRNGKDGKRNPTMPFELWAYRKALKDIFEELPRLEFMGSACCIGVEAAKRRLTAIRVFRENSVQAVQARCFIDSSGVLAVARMAGCRTMLGADSRDDFHESVAPETGDRHDLNKVNWIYRVRPGSAPSLHLRESDIPEYARINELFTVELPCGDMLVNICGHGTFSPEIPGDRARADREEYERAYLSYCWQVASGRHGDWALVGFAPELGIRESYRLHARRILTLNDVLAGGGAEARRFIARTDHPIDVHGTNLESLLGSIPYGIPYETTLPLEYDNLWVASRGIGVTHVVNGSCRLSRTLMTLGEAVGKAAAIAAGNGMLSGDVSPGSIADFDLAP